MKRHQSAVLVLVAAMALAAVSPVLAKESVQLHRDALVDGTLLAAGSYTIEVAPSLRTVRFLQGRREALSVPCRVSLETGRILGNAIHYRPRADGSQEIVRIVLAGSRLSIEVVPVEEAKEVPVAEVRERR